MRLVRRLFMLVAVLFIAAVAFIAYQRVAPRHVPAGQPELATLSGSALQTLRDDFNAHAGEVRVVASLSPT